MAESYANLALRLKADHPGALQLLAQARSARTPAAPAAPAASPAASPTASRAPAGDPNIIGSAAYFLKYARHHLGAGNSAQAARYAREALGVDPDNAEARRILAQAGRAVPAKPANATVQHCDEIYSACYASARRYSPGSPPMADPLGQQQCMMRRNICYGGR